jgi:hypothetical protein
MNTKPISMSEDEIMMNKLPPSEKHLRYQTAYKPGDLFWGVGIEREAYFETDSPVSLPVGFLKNQKRERYSVDYYKSYEDGVINDAISKMFPANGIVELPFLVNAHSLTKMDPKGNHMTTYEKEPKPNPKFKGQTFFDIARKNRPDIFVDICDVKFTFDGDSIEVMTQNFYKCTVEDSIKELNTVSSAIEQALNDAFKKEGLVFPVKWMRANYGLAIMASNTQNLAIFNNGTYHINLTAPTQLDQNGHILNYGEFVERHRKIARYIQWLEPFMIVAYGTPDVFSNGGDMRFASGSLRGALSRYIGIGFYDTVNMPTGKILQIDVSGLHPKSWYNGFHSNSAYKALDKVGVDINFNKHANHGLELRFFDWFSSTDGRLLDLMRILVHVMDKALSMPLLPDVRESENWNYLTAKAIRIGKQSQIPGWLNKNLSVVLGLNINAATFIDAWESIKRQLLAVDGDCCQKMLQPSVEAVAVAAAAAEKNKRCPKTGVIGCKFC